MAATSRRSCFKTYNCGESIESRPLLVLRSIIVFVATAAHGGNSSKVQISIESGNNFKIINKRATMAEAANDRIGYPPFLSIDISRYDGAKMIAAHIAV